MLSLSELQVQWREALLAPPGLEPVMEAMSEHPALAIHRNNFFNATRRALMDVYPTVEALVGAEFFAVMARDFILAEPPGSPVIMDYGDAFPGFIARYPAVRDLPYLADMAAFEWDMHQVRHAAEVPAMTQDDFTGLSEEALIRLELSLVPAARVFVSDYAVAQLWHAHWIEPLKLSSLGSINDATCVLMVRRDFEVSVISLTWGQAVLLESVEGGAGLGVATAMALEEDEAHDISRSNAKLALAQCLMRRA
ncbi:DNA-binding domain-containing protein [Denitrobaculum tricleocarpae]|nr:DNA-binding domain-containing protein [Denitrobaculum tricleocarpae]